MRGISVLKVVQLSFSYLKQFPENLHTQKITKRWHTYICISFVVDSRHTFTVMIVNEIHAFDQSELKGIPFRLITVNRDVSATKEFH